jgi:prepilin-type N-terminal cleavage/methylation domain-containing protein
MKIKAFTLVEILIVAAIPGILAAVDGTPSGWLSKKEAGEFKINWPGTDSEGINFYGY